MQIDSLPGQTRKELQDSVFGTARMVVRFFDQPVVDRKETERCGFPRYATKLYVLRTPVRPDLYRGDGVSQVAQPHHIHEHPDEYQEYLDRRDKRLRSLELLPFMTVQLLKELEVWGLRSIESLLDVSGPEDLASLRLGQYGAEARGTKEFRDLAGRANREASNAWPMVEYYQKEAQRYEQRNAESDGPEPHQHRGDGDLRERGGHGDGGEEVRRKHGETGGRETLAPWERAAGFRGGGEGRRDGGGASEPGHDRSEGRAESRAHAESTREEEGFQKSTGGVLMPTQWSVEI